MSAKFCATEVLRGLLRRTENRVEIDAKVGRCSG
jgi:hypothetical protein